MKYLSRRLSSLLALLLTVFSCAQHLSAQDVTNPPVVTIVASDPDASEIGPDTGTFTVTRTGSTNLDLTVFYHAGGSAKPGVDYEALTGHVLIPAGATSADITVTPISDVDTTVETNETVEARLLLPIDLPVASPDSPILLNPYQIGSPSNAVVNIAENGLVTNPPPYVRIVSPLNGAIFIAPANITLIAHAEDSNGQVETVEFFEGTNSLGIKTNLPVANPIGPFVLTLSDVAAGAYTFTAKATDDQGATRVSEPVNVKVLAIPPTNTPPVVTVVASDPDASEIGPDTGTFTVTRTDGTNDDLTVFYHVGGSAKAGSDYQPLSGHVTIPAGASSADITVTPISDVDTTLETNETVEVRLLSPLLPLNDAGLPTIWPPPYLIGSPSNAVVNIAENGLVTNFPPHVFIVSPLDGTKFAAPATIMLVARAEAAGGVTNVEFFAGTNSLGQATFEPTKCSVCPNWVLTWSNVVVGDYSLTAKATDSHGTVGTSDAVTIHVIDVPPPPVVTVIATDPDASEIGPDTGTFTVSRTGGTNDELMVFYHTEGAARPGTDYQALSGHVTIPAGALSADITVTPIADVDTTLETNETVRLQLVSPFLGRDGSGLPIIWPSPYIVGSPSNAVVNIAESGLVTNFPPHVRIVSPENGRKFVAPADIQIVARAEDPFGKVSTVEFFEGTNSLGVTTNREAMNPLGPFVLVWSNVVVGEYSLTAKATDDQGATGVSDPVNISVVTNSPPPTNSLPVVIVYARDPVAFEGTNSAGGTNVATFVVRRDSGTNSDVTVYYSVGGTASNGVDYVSLPGTVTIPAGERSAKITVVPLEDNDHELLNTVVLHLTPPPTAIPPAYTIGHPEKAAAIIVDRGELGTEGDHLRDGLFHFQLTGMNGFFFRVEASDDLVTWTPVCTNVVTEGAIHFVDPDADGHSRRFYRVLPEADANDDD